MAEATPVKIYRMEEKRRRYRSGGFFLKIGLLALFVLQLFGRLVVDVVAVFTFVIVGFDVPVVQ